MIISIIALGLLGSMSNPVHAKSRKDRAEQKRERRERRDSALPGVLVGAGAGGTIAAVAGSAQWAPLGIVGGGIAGYFLIKAMRNNNRERVSHRKSIETKGRPHITETPQTDKKYEGKQ